jgi:hypothetical protein
MWNSCHFRIAAIVIHGVILVCFGVEARHLLKHSGIAISIFSVRFVFVKFFASLLLAVVSLVSLVVWFVLIEDWFTALTRVVVLVSWVSPHPTCIQAHSLYLHVCLFDSDSKCCDGVVDEHPGQP